MEETLKTGKLSHQERCSHEEGEQPFWREVGWDDHVLMLGGLGGALIFGGRGLVVDQRGHCSLGQQWCEQRCKGRCGAHGGAHAVIGMTESRRLSKKRAFFTCFQTVNPVEISCTGVFEASTAVVHVYCRGVV